jgi:hypothetical protein
MKIDKSRFTPEELTTYKALIAKAVVPDDEGMEEEKPDFPPRRKVVDEEVAVEEEETEKGCSTRKSADPALTAALERMERLEKSIEMKEFTEIAKRYAALGEDEEELAYTLYDMHKSDPDNYAAYVKILDKSLAMVEKSGLFAEIGKSAGGFSSAGGTVEKVNQIAGDIMKSDPGMSREQAIAKAWTDHPELVEEYDREYKERR